MPSAGLPFAPSMGPIWPMFYLGIFRLAAAALLLTGLVACGPDGGGGDTKGIITVDSPLATDDFRAKLLTAIADHGLQVIDGACGKCAIKTIDVPEQDTETLTVYAPQLTVRMMQAGAAAGSDAPLRFYVSKIDGGQKTRLTYHLPSQALAIFNAPDLKPVGDELDRVFGEIVAAVE